MPSDRMQGVELGHQASPTQDISYSRYPVTEFNSTVSSIVYPYVCLSYSSEGVELMNCIEFFMHYASYSMSHLKSSKVYPVRVSVS